MDYWTFQELRGRFDADPSRGPRARWVMGSPARWPDPHVQAELAMHELAQRHAALTALTGAAALVGSLPAGPDAGLLPLRLVVRLLRLACRAARGARPW